MAAVNSSTILISFSTTPKDSAAATTPAAAPNTTVNHLNMAGPPYTVEQLILFVMFSVFFVLGVVGNALAFYIYYQKRDKTTSTLFILSLAATDFFTCLIGIPYSMATEMLKYWVRYDLVCKCYMFIITFNIPLSAFIMVAVGFDRYFCICHPFLHIMTVKRAKICLVCLTLLASGCGLITALSHGVYYIDTEEELIMSVPPSYSSGSPWSSSSSSPAVVGATAPTVVDGSSSSSIFGGVANGGGGGGAGAGGIGGGSVALPGGSAYSVVNGSSSNQMPVSAGSSMFESTTRLLNAAAAAAAGMGAGGGGGGGEGAGSSSSAAGRAGDAAAPAGDGGGGEGGQEPLYIRVNVTKVIYWGQCVNNQLILSKDFITIYQKVYAAFFLLCFLIVALLYALIYRSILIRRAWKAKRKRMSCYASTANGPETVAEETQLTNINNGSSEVTSARVATRTSVALRDRMLYANIKTAAMLFVVTVVFVISFLPAWLIGLQTIETSLLLFYVFYLNNVANPFIYAFMNRTFRDDLRQLLKRIKNRLSGW